MMITVEELISELELYVSTLDNNTLTRSEYRDAEDRCSDYVVTARESGNSIIVSLYDPIFTHWLFSDYPVITDTTNLFYLKNVYILKRIRLILSSLNRE